MQVRWLRHQFFIMKPLTQIPPFHDSVNPEPRLEPNETSQATEGALDALQVQCFGCQGWKLMCQNCEDILKQTNLGGIGNGSTLGIHVFTTTRSDWG